MGETSKTGLQCESISSLNGNWDSSSAQLCSTLKFMASSSLLSPMIMPHLEIMPLSLQTHIMPLPLQTHRVACRMDSNTLDGHGARTSNKKTDTNGGCADEALSEVESSHTQTFHGHYQGRLAMDAGSYTDSWIEKIVGQLGPETDVATYTSLLRRCTSAKALSDGICVHKHLSRRGYVSNRFLKNLLIQMYSKCGSMEHARAVFDTIVNRNLYSWTIMIAACSQNGHCKEALQLFCQMQTEGFEPDRVTFICILDACASMAALAEGQDIHAIIVGTRWESDIVVGNSLVNMYGKCGSLDDSRTVFAEMLMQDVVSWNTMIAACAQNRHSKEALELFALMQAEGVKANEITCLSIMDGCASVTALEEGREIHATAVGNGWESDIAVGNALINMYSKCGSLDNSRAVFEDMPHHDVVSWSAMITACAQNRHGNEALQLFGQMQREGINPNKITFICILDACASVEALEEGQEIHATIVGNAWELDVVVGNTLINMYYQWSCLDDSRAVFKEMPVQDVVSWSAMIAECAQNGHGKEALQLFNQMQSEGINPNKITFICILDGCASVAALEGGREIHAALVGNGWEGDVAVGNALIDMYGKCRSLDDLRAVSAGMPLWDVVSLSSMIAACAQHGHGKEALQLFGVMQAKYIKTNEIVLICILDACANMAALEEGCAIHATIVGNGWELDVVVGTALINLYGKCRNLDDSRAIFAEMPLQDVVSFSAMIAVCTQNGYGKEGIHLFGQIQSEGINPDKITFVSVLDACASVAALEEGQEIHATIVGYGWDQHDAVGTALVNMYGKCGSLVDSRAIFAEMPVQDVILWSAMITVCAQNGHGKEALQLFGEMQTKCMKADKITFICVLDACTSEAALEVGQEIHTTIVGSGWELDAVIGTALVNMYGKCGCLDDSGAVFARISMSDVVSFSAMIAGYAQNGHGEEALQLFGQMQAEGFKPDKITFISVLDACASVVALEGGQEIHATLVGSGWDMDIVGNALINMYGKCGSLDDSKAVFADMPLRDVVSWNAMITACAKCGHGKDALQLFDQMHAEGVQPDEITFICILTACSHTGLLADGRRYFTSMIVGHGIVPSREHYMCMIDLLGRRGLLEEAEDLIISMPFEDLSSAWLSLLSTCRLHSDTERAVRSANFVFELDPRNASPYLLLTNFHANTDRIDDTVRVG